MKPPPDIYFRSELNLMIWKPRGVLNERSVNQILAFVREEEAKSDANPLRFIDTSALDAVDLNFRYVFHVALHRRMSRMGRPTVKTACYVEEPVFEHYFKLHALLTDRSPLRVQLFKRTEAAAKWLDVPLESLQAP
jgi:hypothetical protein